MSYLTILISALLSGVLAVFISTIYNNHKLDRQIKIDTFKKVFSNRYDLQGVEFSQAINEIFVIYNDSEQVIMALNNFHDTITNNKNSANEDLLILLKAMCKEVKIDDRSVSDSFFLTPFNTKPSSMKKIN